MSKTCFVELKSILIAKSIYCTEDSDYLETTPIYIVTRDFQEISLENHDAGGVSPTYYF